MLKIEQISKSFGDKNVLDRLTLDIDEGKIFTLLGASGCGKTTLLRIIAGLDHPDDGSVIFKGTPWVSSHDRIFVAPQKRNIGLVFQSYAIWPHMKVFDQIAYPLRNQGMNKTAIRQRVEEMLDVVNLTGLEDRPGPLLSGGQQQRVALARALAPQPDLLLLDEPFSNLDVELRVQLRPEIRRIQRRLGITVVLVTHDQLDAFTLSDKVAVMQSGRVEQVGSCRQIYDTPGSEFVRGFIGRSSRLNGEVAVVDQDAWSFRLAGGSTVTLPMPEQALQAGAPVSIWLRPEDLHVQPRESGASESGRTLFGKVAQVVYLGDRYECSIELDGGQHVLAHGDKHAEILEGSSVQIAVDGFATVVRDRA